jgi:hypothetical protein
VIYLNELSKEQRDRLTLLVKLGLVESFYSAFVGHYYYEGSLVLEDQLAMGRIMIRESFLEDVLGW